jgi:hypothetical protein
LDLQRTNGDAGHGTDLHNTRRSCGNRGSWRHALWRAALRWHSRRTRDRPETQRPDPAGGADWQIIRSDGAADISARYIIESDSGAHIRVASDGLRHGPPEILERLARGDSVDPALYYFRIAMRFEVANPALD